MSPTPTTVPDYKERLIGFFRELKDLGIIRSVVNDFGDQLALLVPAHGYKPRKRSHAVTKMTFKHFEVRDAKNCPSGRPLCNVVVNVLPMLKLSAADYAKIKPIYERQFDLPFDILGSSTGFQLFRRKDIDTPAEMSKLNGDYIMMRLERRLDQDREPTLRISQNFLRFYGHGQTGVRFMMLSMAAAKDFMGAKGWVDDLGKSYLCTGQIIDRSGEDFEDEKVYGGTTTLVIDAPDSSKFVIANKEYTSRGYTIEAAPILHLRAVYRQEPSISRGYMVRCRGLEGYGGAQNETARERYDAIRRLQALFAKNRSREISPSQAAIALSKATGFRAKDFFNSVDDEKWPSGLLVNLPFSGNPEKIPQAWPLYLPTRQAGLPNWAPKRQPKTPANGVGITLKMD